MTKHIPGPAEHFKSINKHEALHIILSALAVGFVVSFRDWGTETINVSLGLQNTIIGVIASLFIIVMRVLVQKKFGFSQGYLIRYTIHKWGLFTSIFLAFFAYGRIPFVTAGQLHIEESRRLRLGTFRYGLNYGDLAKIALAGVVVNVALMIIIKPLAVTFGGLILTKIIEVNAAIAFFSLFPIPGGDGFYVFYHRRWWWVLSILFVGLYFFLVLTMGLYSFVIATLFAALGTLVFKKQGG